jgi:hypothetical protein
METKFEAGLYRVSDLRPGMYVDLEGDECADPYPGNVAFKYDYKIVYNVSDVYPYDECVVTFDDDTMYGFPPGHKVFVAFYDKEL